MAHALLPYRASIKINTVDSTNQRRDALVESKCSERFCRSETGGAICGAASKLRSPWQRVNSRSPPAGSDLSNSPVTPAHAQAQHCTSFSSSLAPPFYRFLAPRSQYCNCIATNCGRANKGIVIVCCAELPISLQFVG